MSNDRKKEAFARRHAINKVNAAVALLSTEDILWLAELGNRLVEKNNKTVVPDVVDLVNE
mgnify:CR=1 FL=1